MTTEVDKWTAARRIWRRQWLLLLEEGKSVAFLQRLRGILKRIQDDPPWYRGMFCKDMVIAWKDGVNRCDDRPRIKLLHKTFGPTQDKVAQGISSRTSRNVARMNWTKRKSNGEILVTWVRDWFEKEFGSQVEDVATKTEAAAWGYAEACTMARPALLGSRLSERMRVEEVLFLRELLLLEIWWDAIRRDSINALQESFEVARHKVRLYTFVDTTVVEEMDYNVPQRWLETFLICLDACLEE